MNTSSFVYSFKNGLLSVNFKINVICDMKQLHYFDQWNEYRYHSHMYGRKKKGWMWIILFTFGPRSINEFQRSKAWPVTHVHTCSCSWYKWLWTAWLWRLTAGLEDMVLGGSSLSPTVLLLMSSEDFTYRKSTLLSLQWAFIYHFWLLSLSSIQYCTGVWNVSVYNDMQWKIGWNLSYLPIWNKMAPKA